MQALMHDDANARWKVQMGKRAVSGCSTSNSVIAPIPVRSRWREPGSVGLPQNRSKVSSNCLLKAGFAANGVVIEDYTVATNIKGKLLSTTGKQNCWLAKRMRIPKFIEDIGVRRADFGHNSGCFTEF